MMSLLNVENNQLLFIQCGFHFHTVEENKLSPQSDDQKVANDTARISLNDLSPPVFEERHSGGYFMGFFFGVELD
jgi:hypothetical protein